MICKKIKVEINDNLEKGQFGFRKNKEIREVNLCLRIIMEKMYKVNKLMYIAFVNLERAFNNVNWETLSVILKYINIDTKDRKIIKELNLKEKAVLIEKKIKAWEEVKIETGGR